MSYWKSSQKKSEITETYAREIDPANGKKTEVWSKTTTETELFQSKGKVWLIRLILAALFLTG